MSTATESSPVSGRTTLIRARVIVLAILTLDVLVLLVTGIVLFFTYRPAGDPALARLFGDEARSGIDLARATTTTHSLAAQVAVPAAIAAGVLIAVEKRPRTGRLDVVVGIGLAVIVLLGSFTGSLLPWDQLGLWAVTVGKDMGGYRPLFDDDQVRFVIVGGALIAPGTIVRWLLVHMLVVGAGLAVLLTIAWRRTLHRSPAPERAEPSATS